jgi:hypothetical protein
MSFNSVIGYDIKVFTPTRSSLAGRGNSSGLVASYTETKIFNPTWEFDKLAMISSAQFFGIPKNRDGSVNVDIRKDDIIEFGVRSSLAPLNLFCAVVDVAPHPDSMGAGVLGDEDVYECYKLVSPLTLLEGKLMPDVAGFADFEYWGTGAAIAPPHTYADLVREIASSYLPSSVRYAASYISNSFTNKHVDFYEPYRTLKDVFESVATATNHPDAQVWIDAYGYFHFEAAPNDLENLGALPALELLPSISGQTVNKVVLMLADKNKFPSDLNGKVVITNPQGAQIANGYGEQVLTYTLQHSSYASNPKEKSYQLSFTPQMLTPNDALAYSTAGQNKFSNVSAWFNADLTDAVANAVVNTGGNNNNLFLSAYIVANRGVAGFRIAYSFFKTAASSDNPMWAILRYYNSSNALITSATVELPYTTDAVTTFDYSFLILPDRGTVYSRVQVEFFFRNGVLSQVGQFQGQYLQIYKTKEATLQKLAEKLLVIPSADVAEVLLSESSDLRSGPPALGLLGPTTRRVTFSYAGQSLTKTLESVSGGVTHADGVFSVLRWGRPDPATLVSDYLNDDARRKAKHVDARLLETNWRTV